MPVELGRLYAPQWKGVPPHMSSQDLALWDRFQEFFAGDFSGFYFDAALGTTAPPGDTTDENMIKMWQRVTSKRIDAVGVKADSVWVMEFRPNASVGALGSILTYVTLWRDDPPLDTPAVPVIVTDFPDPDLISLAARQGIRIIKV